MKTIFILAFALGLNLISTPLLVYAEDGGAMVEIARDKNRTRKERVDSILRLGKMKAKDQRGNLEDILRNEEDKSCREASAIALGELGVKKAIPKLKEALNDKEVNVRMRAVRSLAKLGDKSGKELALETIRGENATGQLLAAEALEAIGDRDVLPKLEENLKHRNVTVRWHSKVAIKKLEMVGMSEQGRIEHLGKILSSNEMNNWASVELTKIGSAEAITMLKKVAEDAKNPGSYAAQKALNKLKEMGKLP